MNQKDQKLYDKFTKIKPNLQKWKVEIEAFLSWSKDADMLDEVEQKEVEQRMTAIAAIEERMYEIELKKGWVEQDKEVVEDLIDEEIVTPYPNFQAFQVAVMPLLEERVEEYLNKYGDLTIASRGDVTYTNALLSFLGIATIGVWNAAFRTNSSINNYLQNIYNNNQAKLTTMSVNKYADIIARNIWLDFIEAGLANAQAIQTNDFPPSNEENYNLSDALDLIQTRNVVPRGFRRRVDQYQQNILDPNLGQPVGFKRFIVEWEFIIKQITSYEASAAAHANMSQRQIRQNIQNMFTALDNLIATGQYFTLREFLSSENIVVFANPQNGSLASQGNGNNAQGNNTNQTTDRIFNPGYQIPVPGNLNPPLAAFNGIVMNFPAIPPVPSGLLGPPLTLWLNSNNLVAPTNLALVQNALVPIALFLNANPTTTITITGISNFGVLGGVSNNPSLTRQIGLERANVIVNILTNSLGVSPTQITTTSAIGNPGIQITTP